MFASGELPWLAPTVLQGADLDTAYCRSCAGVEEHSSARPAHHRANPTAVAADVREVAAARHNRDGWHGKRTATEIGSNLKVWRQRRSQMRDARNHPGPRPDFYRVTLGIYPVGFAHGVCVAIAGDLTKMENLHVLVEQIEPII